MNDSASPFGLSVWRWLLTHAGWLLILMLLNAGLLYPQEIQMQLVGWLKGSVQWFSDRQVQQKVATEFIVKSLHQRQSFRFISLLKRDTVVLLFTPNCRACEDALVQLSTFDPRMLADAGVDLMILTPSLPPPLADFSHLPLYQPSAGFQPELFDSMIKPTLLRFNAQGKLLAKTVGWSRGDFMQLAGLVVEAQ